MADHNDLGKIGESEARTYLKKKGYTVLAVNYRFNRNEIDIIARIGNELAMIEVKTRQNTYLADPSITVPRSKQKGIIKAANHYVQENELELDCRFDVLTVLIKDTNITFEHIEDAFYPEP